MSFTFEFIYDITGQILAEIPLAGTVERRASMQNGRRKRCAEIQSIDCVGFGIADR